MAVIGIANGLIGIAISLTSIAIAQTPLLLVHRTGSPGDHPVTQILEVHLIAVEATVQLPRHPLRARHIGPPGGDPREPADKQKLLERQRAGKCLTCGSLNHPTEKCRRTARSGSSYRPPTPRPEDSRRESASRESRRPDSASSSRQRVNFNVATIVPDPFHAERGRYAPSSRSEPRTSVREGDVEDSHADSEDLAAVEAYMAARALRPGFQSSPGGYASGYTSQSDFD